MPSKYKLRNNPLDINRILKTCKQLIEEAGEDRKLALEAHKYFKDMVQAIQDSGDEDARPNPVAMNLMVECLKVAQNSKNNVVKILSIVSKIEESNNVDKTKASSSKSKENFFQQLDELTNE